MDISKDFKFEAAHRLTMVPPGHKCAREHGHSYRITVVVSGPVGLDGMVIDFAQINDAVKPLIDQLDHHRLNDLKGLENPTAENLAVWLWVSLWKKLPGLSEIVVHETDSARCSYRGK